MVVVAKGRAGLYAGEDASTVSFLNVEHLFLRIAEIFHESTSNVGETGDIQYWLFVMQHVRNIRECMDHIPYHLICL